jgi:hypothetical protein
MGVAVLVGTRKGLFVLTSDDLGAPLEEGTEIRLVAAVAGG